MKERQEVCRNPQDGMEVKAEEWVGMTDAAEGM